MISPLDHSEHANDQLIKGAMTTKSSPMTTRIAFADLVAHCHDAANNAGWWIELDSGYDTRLFINNPRTPLEAMIGKALVAQKLALVHSEISEALEGHRKDKMDDKLTHRPMIEVELADAFIRIADLAGAMNLDLAGAVVEKLQFNASREDHKISNRKSDGGKKY